MTDSINTNPLPPPPSDQNSDELNNFSFAWSGVLTGLLTLFLIFFLLNYFNIISLSSLYPTKLGFLPHLPFNSESNPDGVIAKVGNELIYQKDLDTEITYYPPANNIDVKTLLLKKIEKDSMILQAAHKEGLVQLDNTVFNSPQKDYAKRIQLVTNIENMINSREDNVSGSIISIWFFNDAPGAAGYENGRKIALDKITALHDAVKAKKITMQQAAQEIINDSGLSQVDTSYKSNAIFTFKSSPEDKITYDPVFDASIRSLQVGQVSDIYLGKVSDDKTGKKIDAVYMFAQVISRLNTGQTDNFEQWYAQQEKKYEITTY